MTATQAARMLRRTLAGATIAACAAALLWWTSLSADGRPVLWIAAVLLFGAVYEVGRMGALRDRLPDLVLLAPAAALVLLQNAAAETAADRALWRGGTAVDPRAWDWAHQASYPVAVATAVVLAALVFGILRSLRGARLDGPLARVLLALLLGLLFFLVFHSFDRVRFWLLVGLAPILLVVLSTLPVLLRDRGAPRDLAIAVGLAAWLLPPLPALWSVWAAYGALGLAGLIVVSKIGDTAGYYGGQAFGRRHPFPRLSPGKTTEGCLASLCAGTLAGVLLVALGWLPAEPWGLAGGALAGAVTNLGAQSGDLLESWVKRRAGVKDSSRVFGPSGGLLDQLDSLLVSIPVAVLLWPLILHPVAG
jgi:phosphatidate cytidylyltransferase